MNKLVAVIGMCGSGKSIATDYLENQGWTKIYFGGVTYKLMAEAGIARTPDGKSEKEFREKLRQEHGPECYAKFLEPEIREALEKGFLKLVCIVVDKRLRYERIANRKDRPWAKEDTVYRDISEIENLAKGGPIAYSDYFLFNNGSLEDYQNRLSEILEDINTHEGEK